MTKGGCGVDNDKNPTPPAESASDTPPAHGEEKRTSVTDLLAAARGDVVKRDAAPKQGESATAVPPSAHSASTHTHAEQPATGDSPTRKEAPAATPVAARVAPDTGASKTTSTPTSTVNKGVTKNVGATAAAKPAGGTVVQSTPEPPINKLRRRVVWASVAGFLGVSFLMFIRFFLPRAIFEPSTRFRIGFPNDYNFGVDTKWQQQRRIWVVKNSERLFVIYARCTHLGCTPDWKESENKFKCPCHGSGYDSEGINFEGPAPRPMDRAYVEIDPEGQIVVDTGKLFMWEKGGVNQFNDEKEGAYLRV
jgi:cytochrome b6-f complex iron-sulfur subunit